jgi:hypothetical protein
MGYSVPCTHWFVAVGWRLTPTPLWVTVAGRCIPPTQALSLLGLPLNRRGQGLHDDASVTPSLSSRSHLLGASPRPIRDLAPFLPCF